MGINVCICAYVYYTHIGEEMRVGRNLSKTKKEGSRTRVIRIKMGQESLEMGDGKERGNLRNE